MAEKFPARLKRERLWRKKTKATLRPVMRPWGQLLTPVSGHAPRFIIHKDWKFESKPITLKKEEWIEMDEEIIRHTRVLNALLLTMRTPWIDPCYLPLLVSGVS